jgi:integrase/recombinase XerD
MPRRGRRVRIAEDIYKDGSGLSVVVVCNNRRKEKRFPHDTPIKTMRDWQKAIRRELEKLGTSTRATLADDIHRYVKSQITIQSKKDRARDIQAWIEPLGHRTRSSLTTRELDSQLREWRQALAASTVNHRRSALSSLFVALDGPESYNPVKGCVWFKPPARQNKAIDRARIMRVLARFSPDRKTRWRLELMHWTGMRPSQMARLRENGEDFYLDDRAVNVVVDGVDRKVPAIMVPAGKGGEAIMMPLTAEGEHAAREFLRVGAFGRWSCQSANKHLKIAAAAAGETPFHVYQIKHSFAFALRRTHTDVTDIQEMLGHADIASTLVYAATVKAKHVLALDRLRDDDARRATERATESRDSVIQDGTSRNPLGLNPTGKTGKQPLPLEAKTA